MLVNYTSEFGEIFNTTTNINYIIFSCLEFAAHKLLKLSKKIIIA